MKPSPVLRCPTCRGPLTRDAMATHCALGHRWGHRSGVPVLHDPASVRGKDRLMRAIYDGLPSAYDPFTAIAFPLFGAGNEAELRRGCAEQLGLARTGPLRVLEVGIGTGANLPFLREARAGAPMELWGVDLSLGMLEILARRERAASDLHLLVADVHALPFADASFDAVLHVGATNNFNDPVAAVAEMTRVAKPGAPVVVVDERLDPQARNTLWHRLAFRAVTFYEARPIAPLALVPPGATEVRDDQPTRFFYRLSFRAPGNPTPA